MEGIMHRLENKLYQEDLETVAKSPSIDWVSLKGATIAISGATGMIGTFLVDLLMHKTAKDEAGIRVIAMGRDEEKAHKRLPYFDDPHFSFDQVDVSLPGSRPSHPADVVIHLASTTHPRAYATDPIGTVTSNIQGLMNLLDYACMGETPAKFVFASSVEVYGQNRGDTEKFSEDYCGYINSKIQRRLLRIHQQQHPARRLPRVQTLWGGPMPGLFVPKASPRLHPPPAAHLRPHHARFGLQSPLPIHQEGPGTRRHSPQERRNPGIFLSLCDGYGGGPADGADARGSRPSL